jgi:hypothetical protein
VQTLLAAGANPLHEDVTRGTALGYAEQTNHLDVAAAIKSHTQAPAAADS